MSGVSTPILLASVFFTGLSAFGAGYLLAPPTIRTIDTRPIVDPEAWNRTAPVNPGFQAQATPAQVDAAMQDTADDLSQRGWIDPETAVDAAYQDDQRYQNDVRSIDAFDSRESGSYAVEPLEGAGSDDGNGSATIMVLDKAEADRAWDSWPAAGDKNQQAISATTVSASR